MTGDQAQRVFQELKAVSGRDGCKLEDVSTENSATRVTWSRSGAKLPPVLVAPRGCLVSPDLDGPQLQATVPSSVRASCPTSYATLRKLIGKRVGMLESQATTRVRGTRLAARVTAMEFALLLLLLVVAGIRRIVRPRVLGAEQWRWALLAACAFLLALALRWSVPPALANWYTIVLPASGGLGGRFGAGGLAFQRALSFVLPWSDTTLFTADAVLGAVAVAVAVGIARERRLPAGAAVVLAVLFALAPLHVRISASPSEHVLASTLTLAALWLWLRAERLDSKLDAALALLLMAAAVLTRVEAWIQIAAIGLWGVLRDPVEEAPPASVRWRYALVFLGAWLLVGAFGYYAIVLPSHEPGPALDGIRRAAGELLNQYRVVAFAEPHWISPLAVVLALPGLFYLLVRRWRLLVGIVAFLVLAFVPLGRTLEHDGLLGGRYFLATLPIFLMLSACGVYACGRGIAWGLARVPGLAGMTRLEQGVTALLVLGVGLGDLALVAPAYRARYTFQDEYDFLRSALARVPDGCTVIGVAVRSPHFRRDLDCCLDVTNSPISLAYPRLHFAALGQPSSVEGPGCRYYYESAACSIDLPESRVDPVDRPALDFLRRACRDAKKAHLTLVDEARVSPRSTNGFFGQRAPEVRLFRVGLVRAPPPKQ